jgi:hypothetical protein
MWNMAPTCYVWQVQRNAFFFSAPHNIKRRKKEGRKISIIQHKLLVGKRKLKTNKKKRTHYL